MTQFSLTVRYAAGHEQHHPGLTAFQVEQGAGAFLRDLISLGGQGITRLVAEVFPCPTCGGAADGVDTFCESCTPLPVPTHPPLVGVGATLTGASVLRERQQAALERAALAVDHGRGPRAHAVAQAAVETYLQAMRDSEPS